MEQILYLIEAAISARDPYTVQHQHRVAQLSCAIGSEMGLAGARQQSLWLAALVHDLGKIAVPMEILNKSGKLGEMEFSLIKAHPQKAYDILQPLKFFGNVPEIVLQHHERLDGRGYPYGLKGESILLEARILGVADVVEAICSHRPYRPALGLERALEEITWGKETLYDPKVVDACLNVWERGGRGSLFGELLDLPPGLMVPPELALRYATG